MATRVPARLTTAQGRRFGLTVGGAFLVFAAIAYWRGHSTSTAVLGGLGATLALAGLIIPAHLGPVERAWMRLAHLISKVTTPIVMGVMYLRRPAAPPVRRQPDGPCGQRGELLAPAARGAASRQSHTAVLTGFRADGMLD